MTKPLPRKTSHNVIADSIHNRAHKKHMRINERFRRVGMSGKWSPWDNLMMRSRLDRNLSIVRAAINGHFIEMGETRGITLEDVLGNIGDIRLQGMDELHWQVVSETNPSRMKGDDP